ncbi:MAG TPA: hypothetical protein VI669_15055, partial [Vicinamibacteria bacterium]
NARSGVKAKSYTQDDVKKAPPLANDPNQKAVSTGPTEPPSPEPPPSESGAAPSSGPTVAGRNEAAWRERIVEARSRIEAARKDYEYWSGYTMVVGDIFVDEQDRPVITSIEQLQGKTAAAKKAVEAAEKALVNLEEEARKAGVPPGWLR